MNNKKLLSLIGALTFCTAISFGVASCSDDNSKKNENCCAPQLYSPVIFATQNSSSSFTGLLSAYPCKQGSSIYFGNYNKLGELAIVNATYTLLNSDIKDAIYPLRLPIGEYDMVYWAVPLEDSKADATALDPSLRINGDLSLENYSLRPHGGSSSTYVSTYGFCHANIPTDIGTDTLKADLKRVVAGIVVIAQNSDGSALQSQIESLSIIVPNIPQSLNFFTAAPSSTMVSVEFGLSISADRKSATNKTAYLFPSSSATQVIVKAKLNNGQTATATANLIGSLAANSRITVTVNLTQIIITESSASGFTVDNFNEQSEIIDAEPFE